MRWGFRHKTHNWSLKYPKNTNNYFKYLLRLPPAKKTLVSKSDLGRPLPKASNSSRIRAQVTQNRNRKNCRNVAYKTHSKERDKKRLPPARKTFVSKSDLGRPLPKASNSSRIRAQVTQNRNRKNCRNVAYKTHSKERDKKRLPPAKKTLVSKSDLGRPLPKASNSSRIRAQVTQNRNRKNCRNVAYKTHSKERDKKRLPPAKKTLVSKSDLGRPLPKASNSSRIRAQVTQNRNRKNCRNVAYKTHSKERDKKRLPPARKTFVSKSDLGRPLPKASNSSRIRAQVTQNRNRKNCRNVAYKTHSKERDKKRLPPAKKTLVSKSDLGRPLPKASNSSRIRAQVTRNRKPQKLPKRRIQNPLKRKRQEKIASSKENLSLEIWPWKTASESLKQQQDSSPSHAKPQKLPKRRIQNPLKRKRQEKIASSKENLSLEIWPWKTASESLKQQQDSSPSHAKPQPQKLPKRRLQNPLKRKRQVSKSDLGRPLPKASNSTRIRAQVTQNRNRKNCRNVAYKTHSKETDKKRLPPAKKTLVSKSDLGRPLPKASNSSRTRAQVTQNRNRKNCRNVAYKTHSKERDKKRLTPAKKTLVSKSDLGRPLPKASNSSRIRAQVTQHRNRKNCRNVAYKTHSKERDKKRLPPAKKTLVSTSDLPPAKKTLVSKSDLGRPLPKASNSSRIRAQVTQNRNRKNCRNVAYKTHSKQRDKKRLPPAKKTLVSKSDLGRPLPKASNSSRIRAQVTQNQEKIASSKENLSLEIWPWKTASESLKQQQDSSPSHAKPQPQKLPKRRLQNPLKRKRQEKIASSKENLSLEIWPWKTASESLKQQQDSSPSHAKPQPQKLPKRRLQNPLKRKRQEKIASSKENLSLEIWPWKTACESLKQQQDSSPKLNRWSIKLLGALPL